MKPEIWAREGGDLTLSKSTVPDTYTFRITDEKGEVTVRFDISERSLRSLKRWITEILK